MFSWQVGNFKYKIVSQAPRALLGFINNKKYHFLNTRIPFSLIYTQMQPIRNENVQAYIEDLQRANAQWSNFYETVSLFVFSRLSL